MATDRWGRPLDWFGRNVIQPVAYGGDQAMNDWFGERGLARPLTQAAGLDAWKPEIEEPDSTWGQFASEVPRAILSSGGLAGASRIAPAVIGAGVAGYARDPGDAAPESQARNRLVNAMMGTVGGGLGAMAGKGLTSIGEGVWLRTLGREGAGRVKAYGEFGDGYASAKAAHGNPEVFGKALDDLPTGRGTYRRGIRPDHPTELQQIAGLKEGDVWKPGKGLSMDSYNTQSYEAAHGMVNEADQVVRGAAGKRGPYLHITTQNARDAGPVLRWDEVVTKPDAQFRVDRIVRDADGNVTDMYLTDLSKAGFGRTAVDAGKAGLRSGTALAPSTMFENERRAMEKSARTHGRYKAKRQ